MSIDFKKELNAEQFAVVANGEGACLVLAGAGSGKTRVITYRVAYLLEKGVEQKNILLLTFTNKAAREMLERVKRLTGNPITDLWGGTFHNIGFRIVQRHAALLGYPNHLTILDSEDSRNLLTQVLKEEGIDPKDKKYPSASIIADVYSYQRNAMIPIEEALDIKHPRSFSLAPDLARIVAMYERRKKESGFVDFDDLLLLWLKLLLEFPDVAKKLSAQFKYVLVDEYQDTNRVQARIIEEMARVHGNILAVGDDAQSIYSFRAADIANILDFDKKYKDARVFRLLTNYRSSPEILQVANHVIKQNERQIHKELRSVLGSDVKPRVLQSDTTGQEAERIVDEISRYRRNGGRLSEVAILFRSTFHSQPLEFELARRGMPYDYRGGMRFFERAHVKDVLAYLRAFQSNKDSIAWQRVLTQQEGVGLETAKKIYDQIKTMQGREELLSQGEFLPVDKRARRGWDVALNTLKKIKEVGGTTGDLIRAVKDAAYRAYLQHEFQDYENRLADIDQLANFADRATDLKTFLAEAALQEQYRNDKNKELDRVVLTTIHQAKGLEWDNVFIINLTAEGFPNARAAFEEGGIEEERRLFYVSITRARKQLYLSYATLGGRNNEFVTSPSPFLEEIDGHLLEYKNGPQATVASYEPLEENQNPNGRRRSFLRSIDEL